MLFDLTSAQEECLKGAAGQPVGRKGAKWLQWANGVVEEHGLPPINATDDDKEQVAAPKSKDIKLSKAPTQPAAAAAAAKPTLKVPRTFVLQSGVLKGPGVNFKFTEGIMNGYFEVSRH